MHVVLDRAYKQKYVDRYRIDLTYLSLSNDVWERERERERDR